jgi:hypothetical protein
MGGVILSIQKTQTAPMDGGEDFLNTGGGSLADTVPGGCGMKHRTIFPAVLRRIFHNLPESSRK